MREEQDAADVNRVLAGDVEAFAGIVHRWQGALVTLAFRFCRDRDEAEEMAQKAFVRAYQTLRQWRADAPFRSWLFALAANVYRSEMRRRRGPVVSLDTLRDVSEVRPDAEQGARTDREALVRNMVSKLPDKYRDALVLFYFHQMDVKEASRSLGLAEGTLKARLHRGRELLRGRLGPLLADEFVEGTAG